MNNYYLVNMWRKQNEETGKNFTENYESSLDNFTEDIVLRIIGNDTNK